VIGALLVRNHQRQRHINPRELQAQLASFLESPLIGRSVEIHLVTAEKMAELNETWLQHAGATDVITFDYGVSEGLIEGEIIICVSEAVAQAPRFRSTWQKEIIRYILHGILHLIGYDDTTPKARKKMKAAENKWLRQFLKRPGWKRVFQKKR
jgi:probable rRNA maturation factor